jgi:hypothetical protein
VTAQCGVSPEQIGKGEFTRSDVMTGLDIAKHFGQNPITFLRELAMAPAWMVDMLAWYVSVDKASDTR